MKKFLLILSLFFSFLFFMGGESFAVDFAKYEGIWSDSNNSDFPYQNTDSMKFIDPTIWGNTQGTEDLWKMVATVTLEKEGFLDYFLDLFWFNSGEYLDARWEAYIPKAIIYLKAIINLLLSLLSIISLVMIIYSFYLMFFSDDKEWLDKVKKNIKGILLALLILGLSWAIVSFIFNFYENKILSDEEKDLTIPEEMHNNDVQTQ